MRLERHLARSPPASPSASRRASSRSPSERGSTPSAAARHAPSPPATAS